MLFVYFLLLALHCRAGHANLFWRNIALFICLSVKSLIGVPHLEIQRQRDLSQLSNQIGIDEDIIKWNRDLNHALDIHCSFLMFFG